MTILFTVTKAFDPNSGGVQRTTYKLGKHFTEQGIQVGYYCFSDTGHTQCEYGQLFHDEFSGGLSNSQNLQHLSLTVKEFKPDIIINQMPNEYILTKLLGELKKEHDFILLGCLRNSLFSVVNNLEAAMRRVIPKALFPFFNNKLGKLIALEWHKYLHRRALIHILDNHDKYILLAPPNYLELQYFIGDYSNEKILAIPNNIPSVQNTIGRKKKQILHVGRLNIPQKRSDLLLPFWESCKDQLGDWEFVIVGDGPYKAKLEAEIAKRKIERIRLVGFANPMEYYQSASVFMMPSAYEGFPNTVLEAHSFGCPVFAFNSYPALEWIVNDGKDAYLSKPYDTDEMARQVLNLIKDEKKLTTFQNDALQNAQRFTINKVGEKWIKLFDRLMQRNEK